MVNTSLKKTLTTIGTSLMLFIIVPPVWAAPLGNLEYKDPVPVTQFSVGALLFRLVISLVVVIGLAVVLIKLLQRRNLTTSTGHWMRIIDQVGIGPNRALLLTEIAGRIYILAVTDHNISLLLEINDTSQVAAILDESLEGRIPSQGSEIWRTWRKPFQHIFNAKKDEGFQTREGD